MTTAVASSSSTKAFSAPPQGGAARSRRKQRCWIFHVAGITREVTEAELLSSVRERYTTVKRLVVRPAPSRGNDTFDPNFQNHVQQHLTRNVLVEVQFTGPQPSEGPGALLCDLLCGMTVEAQPVELPRGRKKRTRTDTASSEASDSDVEDGGSRKMAGHRSTNSLGHVEEEDASPGGSRCITAKPIFGGHGGSPSTKSGDPGAMRRTAGSGGPVAASSALEPLTAVGLFKSASPPGGSPRSDGPPVSVSGDGRSIGVGPSEGGFPIPQHQMQQIQRAVARDSYHHHHHHQQQHQQHQIQQQATSQQQQQQQYRQHQQHLHQQHEQQQQQQLLNMQQTALPTQQQHHQQQPFRAPSNGGAVAGAGGISQWDDVVRRMNTPQGSSHSLDMGSVDLSSNGSLPPIKSEVEPLLASSTNGGGSWNSNDSQVALLGPMPPPQAVQPPLRGWSFDSAQIGEPAEFGSGNMVMDLSDVDNLFRAAEGDTGGVCPPAPAPGTGSNDSARSSNADAGAGSSPHHHQRHSQQQESLSGSGPKWGPPLVPQQQQHQQQQQQQPQSHDVLLPMEDVTIEPSRKECNFEGRPPLAPSSSMGVRSFATPNPASQCHLTFTGLDRTGHDLRNLRIKAHFGVDAVHKVAKHTSPLQVGPNGKVYASVVYPSMHDIWPELYSTSNIRVVEVDLMVEIRSESGEYKFGGPNLKVTYLRAPASTDDSEQVPLSSGRRTSSRTSVGSADGPQVSYSCVDYSCSDWLADVCHSVFRGSATAHEPLPDDPNDLMSVDP